MAIRSTDTGQSVEIGGFRLVEQLAGSPAARLYRAVEVNSSRPVALRTGTPFAKSATESLALTEMVESAHRAMTINHLNVARVHGAGIENDWHYVASEWIPQTLAESPSGTGRGTVREPIVFALLSAQGLAAAPAAGLTHGALTPHNILITKDEVPHIVDFGGMALSLPDGRVPYMSPEQANGQKPGPRSDLYSRG